MTHIFNTPCDCVDECKAGAKIPGCVNKLTGEVVTRNCPKCHPSGNGWTWHQDGVCLACKPLNL